MSPVIGLSAFYATQFAIVGIYIPFWPLWLTTLGLSATQIGVLVGIGLWTKVVTNAFITRIADQRGAKRVMIGLALANIPTMGLFFPVSLMAENAFWAALPLTILSSAFFSGKFPLSETLTLALARKHGLEYGRIRLWGSLFFIISVAGGGTLIAHTSPDIILGLMMGGLTLLALVCMGLPRDQAPSAHTGHPLVTAIKTPGLVRLIVCASLIQASHATYYAFATLHWRTLGYSDTTIGALWAEGVIAEIVLFAFLGSTLTARMGAQKILVIAALAGTGRWIGLGLAHSLFSLVALQLLHALTFAATHLAAMHYINKHAPQGTQASAQGLYSSLAMGGFMGTATMIAGGVYSHAPHLAFQVMAILTIMGGLGLVSRRGKAAFDA